MATVSLLIFHEVSPGRRRLTDSAKRANFKSTHKVHTLPDVFSRKKPNFLGKATHNLVVFSRSPCLDFLLIRQLIYGYTVGDAILGYGAFYA